MQDTVAWKKKLAAVASQEAHEAATALRGVAHASIDAVSRKLYLPDLEDATNSLTIKNRNKALHRAGGLEPALRRLEELRKSSRSLENHVIRLLQVHGSPYVLPSPSQYVSAVQQTYSGVLSVVADKLRAACIDLKGAQFGTNEVFNSLKDVERFLARPFAESEMRSGDTQSAQREKIDKARERHDIDACRLWESQECMQGARKAAEASLDGLRDTLSKTFRAHRDSADARRETLALNLKRVEIRVNTESVVGPLREEYTALVRNHRELVRARLAASRLVRESAGYRVPTGVAECRAEAAARRRSAAEFRRLAAEAREEAAKLKERRMKMRNELRLRAEAAQGLLKETMSKGQRTPFEACEEE